jgi:crotonobetainyl-CoA:carnitine CoA-transferase CaiB-like acyl-CoA transferase
MPTALDGLRVIDLTHYIAGPFCTKLMADYGADVVKIERPDGGDPARRVGPFQGDDEHPEKSGLFLHLSTNKRSVTLNLKHEAGKQVLLALAKDADILVESFSPGVMDRLGLGYDVLSKLNPGLVMTSISNFGATGPYRDYKMSELILYGMGGTMHSTGTADREPVKLGLDVEQFFCGAVCASATMGAHLGALAGGVGQHLDLALFELQVGNQDRGVQAHTTYQYNGNEPKRATPGSGRNIMPVGIYPVADGYVHFMTLNPGYWERVCRMIGRPELISDPYFTKRENFYGNAEVKAEFEGLLYEWLLTRTKREVMVASQAVGYPCGALQSMADVFADPHLAAHHYFVEVDHPVTGPLRYPGAPFLMSETPWRAGRAPLLGEHTDAVLGQLGYSGEDITKLREAGAL